LLLTVGLFVVFINIPGERVKGEEKKDERFKGGKDLPLYFTRAHSNNRRNTTAHRTVGSGFFAAVSYFHHMLRSAIIHSGRIGRI
jgi:hypothetical protein